MTDDVENSGMIALIPADPGRLGIPGGEPVDALHCTLVFLGDRVTEWSDDRVQALRSMTQQAAQARGPIDARVFSHSVWNADRAPNPQGEPTKPCLVYQLRDLDGQLQSLREVIVDGARTVMGADLPKQWDPHLPHVAAAYDETDAGKLRTSPGPVVLATLRLAIGTEVHDFPLTENVELAHDEGKMMAKPAQAAAPEAGAPEVTVDEDTGKLELHWPVLVIEGMRTGDGRFIPLGSLGHRGLPLPVSGQIKTDEGHKGAEVFGSITKLERHEGPTVTSKETGKPFLEGTAVWEAWGEGNAESEPGKLAMDGYLRGNSADLADTTSVEELADEDGKTTVELRGGKIAGTTLVPVPAFADGYVEVNGERVESTPATEALVAAVSPADAWTIVDLPPEEAVTASGEEPFRPSLSLFQPRQLRGITPLTVEQQADGTYAVYGHAADFARPHISFTGRRVLARPSPSRYVKGFNTGALRVLDDDGTERVAAVGRLTYGDGHADLSLDHVSAKKVYDDPDRAWAWVQASDDAYGIQVNGVIIPGTPDERVTKALAHPVSGDWRPIDGQLELVAACCVNTAGIPVPRQLVASGQVMALVAAGAVAPAQDNPLVLAQSIAARVVEQINEQMSGVLNALGEKLGTKLGIVLNEDAFKEPDPLEVKHAALATQFTQASLIDELMAEHLVHGMTGWQLNLVETRGALGLADRGLLNELTAWHRTDVAAEQEFSHDVTWLVDLEERGELANWVSKAGGLPSYIKRIEKHLIGKGMTESQAIATAVNAAKKMCTSGDLNFPGSQQVNPGSKAEACAAVAQWNAKKAQA